MQKVPEEIIATEFDLKVKQIKSTIELLDDGNTVPFIARYRKEATGGLNEEEIRKIEERAGYLRNLDERKEEVIRLIAEQGKLDDELAEKIKNAEILQEVEDLYRPYKQKRQTRATKAKEKGLEPLAEIMWAQDLQEGDRAGIAEDYLDPEKELTTVEDVLQGARDIIAEWVSDDADIRKKIREITFTRGLISSELKDEKLDEEKKYKIYYEYKESVNKIPPHRILAINRGEKEEILSISVKVPVDKILSFINDEIIEGFSIFQEDLATAIEDAYKRLIGPSIEREVRNDLTERAEEHAVEVFGDNLRSLLLQPPLRGHIVMGIDPAFRTGCKVCVVDERGKLLTIDTIYPHPPQKKLKEAREIVLELVNKYNVNSIAIGNGTASRETEVFVADIIKEKNIELRYIIVNEAGASVYSASEVARKEFPELDVSMRGAVSIARRLQDPLAELVKISPHHIGVGLYQHDINENRLRDSLTDVVVSVVNYVGVDINTASPSLLQYVAGINSNVAGNIVEYREENDGFKTREELKGVYRLGQKTFQQAAGFIRIFAGDDPLAITPIHPESYKETEKLLEGLGYQLQDLFVKEKITELREKLDKISLSEKAEELALGLLTLKDIIEALKKPGRDPRDELPRPVFREDILKLEDLKKDMILKGTVRNVVDFGAFVDIGVKEDGLVHISEMSYEYVEDPRNFLQVGDIVRVKILNIDRERKRIALSLKL